MFGHINGDLPKAKNRCSSGQWPVERGGIAFRPGQRGVRRSCQDRTLYYLLSLFARAMAQDQPGGSVAEMLSLAKASQ